MIFSDDKLSATHSFDEVQDIKSPAKKTKNKIPLIFPPPARYILIGPYFKKLNQGLEII